MSDQLLHAQKGFNAAIFVDLLQELCEQLPEQECIILPEQECIILHGPLVKPLQQKVL